MSERLNSIPQAEVLLQRIQNEPVNQLDFGRALKLLPCRLGTRPQGTFELRGEAIDLARIPKPRVGSVMMTAFEIAANHLGKEFSTLDIESQAKLCAVLADDIRRQKRQEATAKRLATIKAKYGQNYFRDIALIGAVKRQDARKKRIADQQAQVAVTKEVVEASPKKGFLSRFQQFTAPLSTKIKEGVSSLIRPFKGKSKEFSRIVTLAAFIPAGIPAPDTNINDDVIRSILDRPKASMELAVITDPVTEQRAAVVGGHLELIQTIADSASERAPVTLRNVEGEVEPATREALGLEIRFLFESLTDTMPPERYPEVYRSTVSSKSFGQSAAKIAIQIVDTYNGSYPAPDLPRPTNPAVWLSQLQELLRYHRDSEQIISEMVSLAQTGEESVMDDLRDIASILGKRGKSINPGDVTDMLAEFYQNPVGGYPVLTSIVGNILRR